MKNRVLLILLTTYFLVGCIEQIELELGKNPILVIDGSITNESGPYKVQLSFSSGFNENPLFQPINDKIKNAHVIIKDNFGNEEVLIEDPKKSGSYYTKASGLRGEIGRTYQLTVKLKNGEEYISSFETILPVPEIDNISYELESKDVLNSSNGITSEEFIHFLIDFEDPSEFKNFYRWRYQEDFEYIAPLADEKQAIRDANPPPPPISEGEIPVLAPYTKYCWVTSFDNEYLRISEDALYNGSSVNQFDILSITPDRKLLTEYSILIKQYSLNERAFTFLDHIQSQIENTGTIFETSNFQIQGNMSAVENTESLVLGYFSASGVSSKRVFLNAASLGLSITEINCSPNADGVTPIFCEECTTYPGNVTAIKPTYWPN